MLYSDAVNGDILSALEEFPLLTKQVNKNIKKKTKKKERQKVREKMLEIPGVVSIKKENTDPPEHYTLEGINCLLKGPKTMGIEQALMKPECIPIVIMTNMVTKKIEQRIETMKKEILDYTANKIDNRKSKNNGKKGGVLSKLVEQFLIFIY